MRNRPAKERRIATGLLAAALVAAIGGADAPAPDPIHNLFAQFDLPDAWEARFWADPAVQALLRLEPKALAELVPEQAGIRFCRCPACEASEADDPLSWSLARPQVLTCRRCGILVPSAVFPARDEKEKKVPEETVEVLPRVTHHYPYHAVAPGFQRYPDERLYLAAKRDYEARQFLAKAAMYAAVRHHESLLSAKDPALARLACVLILRFAQVYPAYATHYDQPGSAKVFQQADLAPPFRHGYGTGKWDWTGSLDVPLNLAIAYALVRDDPALAAAGRALGDPHPSRTIERDLFRASATFVAQQPEEYSEMSLGAYRGLLAVGRLLDEAALVHQALARLDGFAERGFYHDGLWRQGDASSHRRILGLIDGWLDRLLAGYSDPPGLVPSRGERRLESVPGVAQVPMVALARAASSAVLSDPRVPEVQQVSWPAVASPAFPRRPALLGGAGLARLAVGQGAEAIDLDVRAQDSFGAPHFQRLAVRVAVGGRPVLGDLDELPSTTTGWDRATASHNTVVVDGLNQREVLEKASTPDLGGDVRFFAADPDFQVVALDDPRAYPRSTTRYRQTIVAAAGKRTAYAVAVFEVHGGLQHDQVFHASAGSPARWQLSVPLAAPPATLLPPSIPYVASARAEDGRWFVQAYGEFSPSATARLTQPATAELLPPGAPGVRLHVLGDVPASAILATSRDPAAVPVRAGADDPGRAGLILRRRSADGATLKSTFVTVFEPTGGGAVPLVRVGRVAAGADLVVIALETAEGPEHLVVNLEPGTVRSLTLADGGRLDTDGLAVRVSSRAVVLAGGTFAETQGRRVDHEPAWGTITRAVRLASGSSRGWFETATRLPHAPALAGRTLLIRHGEGPARGWTLTRVENTDDGARLHVREEPGFLIEAGRHQSARYYQFPRRDEPGPHRFQISKITRSQ